MVYANLQPRYRLADQVPDKQQAVAASGRLDAKLTGANAIDVLIEFPKGASLYAPETLQTIADVHALVEKQAGVGNVWSLETLRRWLAEKAGSSDVATLKEYVDVIPKYLVRRFISADQDAVVVSGRVPDLDSSQILPGRRKARQGWTNGARGASRLRDRGHRPVGDRRAQQRQHDRKAQSRADDRVRAGRDLHRAGVPLGGGDVLLHPAGHFPGGAVGHGAVAARGGAAVRQRRGADGVVRARTERDDSLPQPAAARDAPGADPRDGGRARRPCWSVRR